MMNTMLTAVDCACSVLMIGAAGIDQNETSSFESIAFVLQLVALIGESEQNMSPLHPTFYEPRFASLGCPMVCLFAPGPERATCMNVRGSQNAVHLRTDGGWSV